MNEYSVKFEADVQRQFERYHLPLKCDVDGRLFEVIDWSLDGVGINTGEYNFAIDSIHAIKLKFPFEGYNFDIEMTAKVIYTNDNGRTGLRYDNVGVDQMRLMRYVRDSVLKGEMLSVGEIIDLNRRAAEVKPRTSGPGNSRSIGERVSSFFSRLFGFTLVAALCLGLIGFVISSVYQRMAVIPATSAFVTTDLTPFYAPISGIVTFVATGQVEVGQPLATIQPATGLSQTIMASCSCVIEETAIAPDTQTNAGDQLLTLRAAQAPTYIMAMVPSGALTDLYRGTTVDIELVDGTRIVGGTITNIPNLTVDSIGKDLAVRIDVGADPAGAQVGQPATVRFYRSVKMPGEELIESARAWAANLYSSLTGSAA